MKKCLEEKKKFRHFTQPSKKILFIGAGASYGARESHKNKPPLGPQLLNWLKGKIKELKSNPITIGTFRSEICNAEIILSESSESNFELFIAGLDFDKQIILHKFLRICLRNFEEKPFNISHLPPLDFGFQNQCDLYDDLIIKLEINRQPHEWSIISLNYDILIEQALTRKKIQHYYPYFKNLSNQDQTTLSDLRIFKPHGSINFFSQADNRFTYDGTDPEPGEPTEISEYQEGISLDEPFIFSKKDPHYCEILNYNPVMANYAKHKFSNFNQRELINVRRSVLKIIKKADELWTIGVNPTTQEDDEVVFKIFKQTFKKHVYISKDNIYVENKETSKSNLISSNRGFQDFLKKFPPI